MARGRGKQRGGGGHRGRKKNNSNQFNSKFPKFDCKRNSTHLKEYGEAHPCEDTDRKYRQSDKRRKFDSSVITEPVKSSSDEGTDDEDQPHNHFKQLLSTFSGFDKRNETKAIESDASEGSSEEHGIMQSMRFKETCEDDGEENLVKSKTTNLSDEETDEEIDGEVDINLDPFNRHFLHDMDDQMYDLMSKLPVPVETHGLTWPVLGELEVRLAISSNINNHVVISKVSIEEEKKYAEPGTIPSKIHDINWTKLYVKSQVQNNILTANAAQIINLKESVFTPLQKELFSLVNNYQDLYYPSRTLSNGEEVRFIYCLHAVNHVLKARTKIIHHNSKLSKKSDVPEEFRDQGLVRPKVLIIVPFRDSALRVIKMITSILFKDQKAKVVNMQRFVDEHTGDEISMPRKNPKPEDYEATFTGNTDDTFRIGITVTRNSLKLYADFYSSDIIVASPLGLRVVVGAEGEAERDFDFLASIELLVLDQTELFLMQNWDHLLHVLDHFHLQPKDAHGTDFSRVRSWALNGWARYYRQTLVFSALMLPEISSLFNKRCHNYAGKVRVICQVTGGSICQVVVQLPQVFHRLNVSSPSEAIDARFEFFVKKILPQYKDAIMSRTMIYVPSYFDFVKLRNYLKREDLNFVQICEYSQDGKIARARDMFFHGDGHFLLYSERFHFFRRMRIKGIRHIIFYQPPTFPHFYSEICNLSHESNQNKHTGSASNMSVTVLYSKYDVMQLSALVGMDRAKRMMSSERSVHMFTTGE